MAVGMVETATAPEMTRARERPAGAYIHVRWRTKERKGGEEEELLGIAGVCVCEREREKKGR